MHATAVANRRRNPMPARTLAAPLLTPIIPPSHHHQPHHPNHHPLPPPTTTTTTIPTTHPRTQELRASFHGGANLPALPQPLIVPGGAKVMLHPPAKGLDAQTTDMLVMAQLASLQDQVAQRDIQLNNLEAQNKVMQAAHDAQNNPNDIAVANANANANAAGGSKAHPTTGGLKAGPCKYAAPAPGYLAECHRDCMSFATLQGEPNLSRVCRGNRVIQRESLAGCAVGGAVARSVSTYCTKFDEHANGQRSTAQPSYPAVHATPPLPSPPHANRGVGRVLYVVRRS